MAPGKKVYVLGAGPAALAFVSEIARENQSFIIIERNVQLGGLATTIPWGTHGQHDLGPHKIFTTDKDLHAKVRALLPKGEWLTQQKKSQIYLKNHFLPYPPSPLSLIRVEGIVSFFFMVLDYAVARLSCILGARSGRTFESDLTTRVGKRLYRTLFLPIAQKLWGDPKSLDKSLSEGRVQIPSLGEIIKRLLGLQKTSDFEALTFDYPKGGLGTLWRSIETTTAPLGEFVMGHEIIELGLNEKTISSIKVRDRLTQEVRNYDVAPTDQVLSTLPLGVLTTVLSSLDSSTKKKIKDVIILNDLFLVFLFVDKKKLLDVSWVFVPDPRIIFHRVSEQASFDPGMVKEGGSIVCCEIMNNKLRCLEALSDEDLILKSTSGLKNMGYQFQVMDSKVIRLPCSYPVFKEGYKETLQSILNDLDSLSNFRTIGRQGTFNYIGTLDAMDMGFGAAHWVLSSEGDSSAWAQERARTQHYPVLD
jgi:protoporphyrinogen oxidase